MRAALLLATDQVEIYCFRGFRRLARLKRAPAFGQSRFKAPLSELSASATRLSFAAQRKITPRGKKRNPDSWFVRGLPVFGTFAQEVCPSWRWPEDGGWRPLCQTWPKTQSKIVVCIHCNHNENILVVVRATDFFTGGDIFRCESTF